MELRDHREDLLILPPLRAKRALPCPVRLDAVAVADMNRRRAGQTGPRLLQGSDTPLCHLAHVDVDRWLIELNDLNPKAPKLPSLLVENGCECKGQVIPPAVVFICD